MSRNGLKPSRPQRIPAHTALGGEGTRPARHASYPPDRQTLRPTVETPTFTRQASKLFDEDEKRELIDFLAANPLAGEVIPGTGGVRKLRFRVAGGGKRGGGRVIYYYLDDRSPLYALLAYAKSARTDLTPEERRAVAALAARIKDAARSDRP